MVAGEDKMESFSEFLKQKSSKLNLRFVANNDLTRANGLMFQKPLEPHEGALFVYEREVPATFWNRNVDFPIEIGFFNSNKNLVDVKELQAHQEENVGCDNGLFKYAVEAPIGFFKDIKLGTSLNNLIS